MECIEYLIIDDLGGHIPWFMAAQGEHREELRTVVLFGYHVIYAVKDYVIPDSPFCRTALRRCKILVAHQLVESSGQEIAFHIGEIDVASIYEGCLVAFFFELVNSRSVIV